MATTDARRSLPLTDAQRAVLTTAAARPDAALILPAKLKGGAAQKLTQALLDKALVREVRAKGDQPVWRRDAETGRSFSLVLTKAGRALVAGAAKDAKPYTTTDAPAEPGADLVPLVPGGDVLPAASSLAVPRSGTKLAGVIALLGREQGAGVAEMMAATGWLPHTARAVLTGLRKRGYALTRTAGDGGPVYRISTAPAAAG